VSGHRRPWLTSSLALVLGLAGWGLMFMADATDDYSGWPLVISAAQLPWLWLVDLRAGDDDQASTRMSLAARITASLLLGVAGGVISAAALYAALDVAVMTAVPSGWHSMLALAALLALLILTLAWGLRAWLVSKRRAPREAVRSMLAPLTVFSLPALGLGYVAFGMSRDTGILGALMSWFALVGPVVVLAWTALPWLELLLSARSHARRASAAQATRATKP
jgi:hypothetical protein